jgi:hypothetical protein
VQRSKLTLREGMNGDASFASLGTTFGHLLRDDGQYADDFAVLKVIDACDLPWGHFEAGEALAAGIHCSRAVAHG